MNTINAEIMSGILQYVGSVEDFYKQYSTVNQTFLYHYECLDCSLKYGFLINFIDEQQDQWSVNVPLSLRAYLNVKFYSDLHSIRTSTMHNFMNVISNRYNVSFVCAIIRDLHDEYFETYLIVGDGKKFTALDISISDILSITNTLSFPIYMNNKIIEKRKVNKKTVMGYLE